uniref:Uncharacterized protein n=1 Tax=Romanomermis culicivorax TaxID=13658 RepID=A0A915I8S6_ROMCU
METVDLKKFLRSKTCQQIEVDRTVRVPAPPLKFITRLTQSSASLNLNEIPSTRATKASTVSQQYVTEKMGRGRRSDRQHRILVKYIPVKNEWIYKSDPDPQSPTFKCDIISLTHFGHKCG